MQFQVPQDVQRPDKIVGPLTLVQLIICVIGGGFAYGVYSILQQQGLGAVFSLTPAIIIVSITAAFAFLKIANLPFYKYLILVFTRLLVPSKRYWIKGADTVILPETEKKQETPQQKNTNDPLTNNQEIAKMAQMLDKKNETAEKLLEELDQLEDKDLVRESFKTSAHTDVKAPSSPQVQEKKNKQQGTIAPDKNTNKSKKKDKNNKQKKPKNQESTIKPNKQSSRQNNQNSNKKMQQSTNSISSSPEENIKSKKPKATKPVKEKSLHQKKVSTTNTLPDWLSAPETETQTNNSADNQVNEAIEKTPDTPIPLKKTPERKDSEESKTELSHLSKKRKRRRKRKNKTTQSPTSELNNRPEKSNKTSSPTSLRPQEKQAAVKVKDKPTQQKIHPSVDKTQDVRVNSVSAVDQQNTGEPNLKTQPQAKSDLKLEPQLKQNSQDNLENNFQSSLKPIPSDLQDDLELMNVDTPTQFSPLKEKPENKEEKKNLKKISKIKVSTKNTSEPLQENRITDLENNNSTETPAEKTEIKVPPFDSSSPPSSSELEIPLPEKIKGVSQNLPARVEGQTLNIEDLKKDGGTTIRFS